MRSGSGFILGTAVIVTRTRWEEPPRIRHEVARQMARFFRVLFIETPISGEKKHDTRVDPVAPNIIRCSISNRNVLPVKIQHYLPFVHGLVEKKTAVEYDRVLRDHAPEPLILINFNYDSIRIMGDERFALKVYFCNDDFISPLSNILSKLIVRRRQGEVAARADICFGVSHDLVRTLARYNPNSRLFLPGHEFQNQCAPTMGEKSDKKIKVGFMGYIDNHLNLEWLEQVLSQSDMELHLIGPVEGAGKKVMGFLDKPELNWHGPKFGDELQRLLRRMDVLTIPFDISFKSIKTLVVPNKLYKYLAVGKPVVISDMPSFVDYERGVLYRASGKEDFVEQIRLAYSEDCSRIREKRLEIAALNTWDKKGDELFALIEEHLK